MNNILQNYSALHLIYKNYYMDYSVICYFKLHFFRIQTNRAGILLVYAKSIVIFLKNCYYICVESMTNKQKEDSHGTKELFKKSC